MVNAGRREQLPYFLISAAIVVLIAVYAFFAINPVREKWVAYDADKVPSEEGWEVSTYSTDPNLQTVQDGVLDYLKPVAAHHYTYREVGDLSNAAGTAVEARVKIVYGALSPGYAEVPPFYYGALLSIADGSRIAALSIGGAGIQLGSKTYAMDTKGSFHVYRLELKGDVSSAYVDGKLVLASAPASHVSKRIEWGVSTSSNTGYAESLWDYVRYRVGV